MILKYVSNSNSKHHVRVHSIQSEKFHRTRLFCTIQTHCLSDLNLPRLVDVLCHSFDQLLWGLAIGFLFRTLQRIVVLGAFLLRFLSSLLLEQNRTKSLKELFVCVSKWISALTNRHSFENTRKSKLLQTERCVEDVSFLELIGLDTSNEAGPRLVYRACCIWVSE